MHLSTLHQHRKNRIFSGWPFYVIFLGSFIEGLTGSFGAITGLCLAYIIDSTDDSKRSLRLGVLELSILLGAMTSFLISGIWLRNSGEFIASPKMCGISICLL
jgi:MFS family permease